jgi:hypothetical protein
MREAEVQALRQRVNELETENSMLRALIVKQCDELLQQCGELLLGLDL